MSARMLAFARAALVAALLLAASCPARADGGPVVPDPGAWALIDESQQIAVVRLEKEQSARVDLFISLADRSGESHEVTFFLPLGVEAGDFSVVEETSLEFDGALAGPLDAQVTAEKDDETRFKWRLRGALLLGALPANGGWTWLVAAVPLVFGVMGSRVGAPPSATYETASSQVSIYELDAETDLQALIETTGLDPKVRDTLASLQGQQVAVVTLQTEPVAAGAEPGQAGDLEAQPGIHLGWRSTLVARAGGSTYTYPLGTGRAWASPIRVTRVYIVSPVGVDFRVDYPRIGQDESGYEGFLYLRLEDTNPTPGFAVTEATGTFGRIWRVTYVQTNSAQDLVVTRLDSVSPEMLRAVRHARSRPVVNGLSWPLCLVVGALAWVVAWRLTIGRLLHVPYRWRGWRLYRDALAWAALYAALCLVLAGAGLVLWWLSAYGLFACLGGWLVVVCLPLVPGFANAAAYARTQAAGLKVSRLRAFWTYMLAVLAANVFYGAFALGYAALAGAF